MRPTLLVSQFDAVEGGFGRAPKFPHPMGLEFLLRIEARRRAKDASALPSSQLDEHLLPLYAVDARQDGGGGIYDQVGGGFHRYSTDEIWLVPHFEKMLYDNALLAPVYLHAWQLTGEPRYRRICRGDAGLCAARDDRSQRRVLLDAGRRQRGRGGQVLRLVAQELRDLLGDDDAAGDRVLGRER